MKSEQLKLIAEFMGYEIAENTTDLFVIYPDETTPRAQAEELLAGYNECLDGCNDWACEIVIEPELLRALCDELWQTEQRNMDTMHESGRIVARLGGEIDELKAELEKITAPNNDW